MKLASIAIVRPFVFSTGLLCALSASAVLFTNDTRISSINSNYDGLDIAVTNCVVTIDGLHSFASLQVLNGGVVTHGGLPDGTVNALDVVGEQQVLNGTNGVLLNNSNAILASIIVRDQTRTVTYLNSLDYTTLVDANNFVTLQRTPGSSIPDGATVQVDYGVGPSVPSGMNLAIATDARVFSGGTIQANGTGYGGTSGPGRGGSAGSPLSGGGGGHAGYGGNSSSNGVGGVAFDSIYAPADKGGAGGGGATGPGGNGGGAIKITVGGTLQIDGTISANGLNGTNSRSGGGAGGSVRLTAMTIAGAGTIAANGGAGEPIHGGGGGGGYVALYFSTNQFSGSVVAHGGIGFNNGGAGSVYRQSSDLSVKQVVVDNANHIGTNTLILVTNAADLVVQGKARAVLGASQTIGSLIVASNSNLTTPGYPVSAVTISVLGDVQIQSGGSINADGNGSLGGQGTGGSFGHYYTTGGWVSGGGGGHGGYGGAGLISPVNSGDPTPPSGSTVGGLYIDSTSEPMLPGGGGGGNPIYPAGSGGGVIRFIIAGNLVADGSISANGRPGNPIGTGGGAGGAIWISASNISGSGVITASGGAAVAPYGGGGAGGRIALYYTNNLFGGTITATGGAGAHGGAAGTIYLKGPSTTPQVLADNSGLKATNTVPTSAGIASLTIQNGAAVAVTSSSIFQSITVKSNGSLSVDQFSPQFVNLIVTGQLQIDAGATLSLDGRGYPSNSGPGFGRYSTTSSTGSGGGGGYGGYGAYGSNGYSLAGGGNANGIADSPSNVGSGGGGNPTYPGGAGGGGLHLTVNGILQVDGRLSADGLAATNGSAGGGSGGALWLTLGTLSGSGVISANGGNGNLPGGGGGGGGRIAISYSVSNLFAGTVTAYGGTGYGVGGAGTIFIQQLGATGSVSADNNGNRGTNTLISSGAVTDLAIKNGAAIQVVQGMTFRNLSVLSNGLLTLNIGSQISLFVTSNALIAAGGGIVLDGKGFGSATGQGAGFTSASGIRGGGGYGGTGAGNPTSPTVPRGITYGITATPTDLGSGGGNGTDTSIAPFGGPGGGSIHLTVSGTFTVNGQLTANGIDGAANCGGGSGGSLWLTVGSLAGSGIISANGGNGISLGGGGGGGRIAIYYNSNNYNGALMAYGGAGILRGGAGSIYVKANNQSTGTIYVDNGGVPGTNTPLASIQANVVITNAGVGSANLGLSVATLSIFSNSFLAGSNINMTASGNILVQGTGGILANGTGPGGGLGLAPGSNLLVPRSGGSHGGLGGNSPTFIVYDNIQSPALTGSGGGNGSGSFTAPFGGNGGGIVKITTGPLGVVQLDGTVSVNGGNGSANSGGGSGGSIWISTGTLTGSGSMSANGGAGNNAGGGAGGRIALYFNSNSLSGPISAMGGGGVATGGAGTIYKKFSNASVGSLLIDNNGLVGYGTPLASFVGIPTIPFDLQIQGGGSVQFLSTPPLISNLVVISSGSISAVSQTNLNLAVLQNANIASGSWISADGKGLRATQGSGAGGTLSGQGGGGGYGGVGGASASLASGGITNGSVTQPAEFGSGGGSSAGSAAIGSEGGGAIHLTVGGTLDLEGRIGSDGNDGLQDDSGGGSGGAVWISAGAFTGNGSLTADGGAGELFNGGGGGGGRIAVYTGANSFTGAVTMAGGPGAYNGQEGTFFFATNLFPLQILSQSPTGVVSNGVSSIDLTFSAAYNPATVDVGDFQIQTPIGAVAPGSVTIAVLNSTSLRLNFPLQTTVGNYSLQVGPNIADIQNQSMGGQYVGGFTITLPIIQGMVTNSAGQPVAGVTVQPVGMSAATTDTNGIYSAGVVTGFTGAVTPSLPGFMFVPGAAYFTNVTGSISNQNFLVVTTISPSINNLLSGTNLTLSWQGIPGVAYQAEYSTNLANWLPYGGSLLGTNGVLGLSASTTDETMKFFRVRASN